MLKVVCVYVKNVPSSESNNKNIVTNDELPTILRLASKHSKQIL